MKRMKTPPPSEGRRCAIYLRRSDPSEESRGKSCAQQLEQCRLAAQALGLEVSDRLVFREEDGAKGWQHFQDVDGHNPPPFRSELTRLVREVEAGNVDVFLCWRTDRAFRDEIVAALLLRKLIAHGVRFLTKTQDWHVHTASGYQNALNEANANRAYSAKVGEDVERHLATNAANGLLTRDPSALGFRSGGRGTGAVVALPAELDLVRLIFRWYTRGEDGEAPLSARAIALRCVERGLRTSVGARGHKVKDPDAVHTGSILRVLRNAAYVGKITHDGRLYDTELFHVPAPDGSGRLETVVDEATFEEAKHRLSSGDPYERDPRAKLLNGVVLCPCCGRKAYSQSRGARYERSLFCPFRRDGAGRCRGKAYRTLHASILEGWTREHLGPLLAAELTALQALRTGDEAARELAATERRVDEMLRFEGERLSELVLSLDAQQVAAVGKKLKGDREAVERRMAELRVRVRREAADQHDPLDLLSVDEGLLRLALQRAVRWICVTRKGVVALTRSGAYVGAHLVRGDKRERGGHRPPRILPPCVQATRECRSWIEDSEAFLEGARLVNGRWGSTPPDEELLPDYREEGAE